MANESVSENKNQELKSLTVELFREDLVLIELLRRPNESTLSVIRRALYDNFEFQMLKRTVNYLEKKVEDIAGQKNSMEEEEFEEILERQKTIEKIRSEVKRGNAKNAPLSPDVPEFRGDKEKMKQAMERRWAIKSQIRRPGT
ncbi:hypothetical protein IX51_09585 [uncultured archaeon]|nr:hypothetical protein IX51_09585 [uncultured archaeon]